jgi:hypothetical protein
MAAKNIHETRGTLENGTPPREVDEGGGGTDRKRKTVDSFKNYLK